MILKAENISCLYEKEMVLKDVTLGIDKGEIVGIVGRSGCGKSTLARHLCCYEKALSGKIIFKNRDVSSFNKREMRSFRMSCQMILQDNLLSLDPTMKIRDTLKEVLKYNAPKKKDKDIKKALEKLFIKKEILDKRPSQLSGGERQRINIVRALLIEPEILICDEITSSLDVITQYHMLKLLVNLREDIGLSIFFISHDIKVVKSISDRILIMDEGKICEEIKREDNFACKNKCTRELFSSLLIDHPSNRS